MNKMHNKNIGYQGEKIALKNYLQHGYKLISQNFQTRFGELDLVLEKNKQILVVEVKTRKNQNFGWAEESINLKKLNNIYKTYQILSQQMKLDPYYKLEICIIELGRPILLRRIKV